MTKLLSFLLTLVSLAFFTVNADERIGGTLENVDLLIEDIYNDDGHNFGEKYSAINRAKVSMRVSIELLESENIENHLIEHAVIVDPHRKVDLGSVLQKNVAKGSNWRYEWKATKDK
jgi:hypothetical protein